MREAAAGAGLVEVSAEAAVLRVEMAQPVAGLVWVLRKQGR